MVDIDKLWEKLINRYKQGQPIYFDFKVEVINLVGKNSPNSFPHYIHYYPGRIFPYIPFFIFSSSKLCQNDGIILDPFSGSGTVLLESIINPFYKRDALGVEINPLGRLISKVKTTPLEIKLAEDTWKQILTLYRNRPKLFNHTPPQFKNINLWFSDKAIERLAKLKHSIEEVEASQKVKDFFWVCFSSTIRKVSRADPFIPPPVVLKKAKYKESPDKYGYVKDFLKRAEDPDVLGIFGDIVNKNLKSIGSLNRIEEIHNKKVKARIIGGDARDLKESILGDRGMFVKNNNANPLRRGSVNLIVTSPPYLTAQKYIRTHKLELFWLGIVKENELLELDKRIIGTEKASVGEVDFKKRIGINSIDSLIKWSQKRSPERAALIYKYFADMQRAISEMHRVLKKDGYAAIIVGNNTVLQRKVNTYRLLCDLGESVGFKEEVVLKDDIKGRGMLTRRHNSGGLIKDEYIIIWRKE